MSKLELYFLCVLVKSDKDSKKDVYSVISNKDLNRILKGLTIDELKAFKDANIYIFFDDCSNVFANYNLTSYVEVDPSNKNLIDLNAKTGAVFSGKKVTHVLSLDVSTGAISRV